MLIPRAGMHWPHRVDPAGVMLVRLVNGYCRNRVFSAIQATENQKLKACTFIDDANGALMGEECV